MKLVTFSRGDARFRPGVLVGSEAAPRVLDWSLAAERTGTY